MTFDNLNFHIRKSGDGIYAHYKFPNGYGISVIRSSYSYSDENTYEVAIIHNNDLTFSTPLTNNVLSYQTPEDINKLLEIIEKWNTNQY